MIKELTGLSRQSKLTWASSDVDVQEIEKRKEKFEKAGKTWIKKSYFQISIIYGYIRS